MRIYSGQTGFEQTRFQRDDSGDRPFAAIGYSAPEDCHPFTRRFLNQLLRPASMYARFLIAEVGSATSVGIQLFSGRYSLSWEHGFLSGR